MSHTSSHVSAVTTVSPRLVTLLSIVAGSIFIGLMAQVRIELPFTPVPISMQTFAVCVLAGVLGSRRAALSMMTYLVEGTCGLPVFAGGVVDPVWFLTPRAGYLLAFVGAAFVIGLLTERRQSPGFLYLLLSLLVGEAIILTAGSSWLATFVGVDKALAMGVIPFLPGAAVKITAAAAALRGYNLARSSFKGS